MATKALPKTDRRHWATKIQKRSYGDGREVSTFSVRIQFKGRREWFALGTGNRALAADQALEVWTVLKREGWQVALDRFKDGPAVTATRFGEYCELVRTLTPMSGKAFASYVNKARTVLSESFKMPAPRGGDLEARAQWQAKIDAILLADITKDRITAWRLSRLKGKNPEEMERAQSTVNSLLRSSRALFSQKKVFDEVEAIKQACEGLPDPLPFHGFKLEKTELERYEAPCGLGALVVAAKNALPADDFLAFALCALCGFRKAEADLLLWEQVDFAEERIAIRATWAHKPKAKSIGKVPLDSELIALLKAAKEKAGASEFVLPGLKFRKVEKYRWYRCAATWKRVSLWLKSKGLTDSNPIHALRKLLGDHIATQAGLKAARDTLRHSTITTTETIYAGRGDAVASGLGELIA